MSEPANRDEAIFDAALQLPPEQRAEHVRQACGHDDELRRRVEALLAAHEQAGAFMADTSAASPKPTMVLSFAVTEKPGDRIGRYKLLQQIGEGGCGVAEQEEPVRRRVALKVIKLGMDTKSVIARFEAERQALALMDHPNIAKVLDAGATENGRPFFVMELVRGIKITDYCDQNKLATGQRLALFMQVCNAIQHAHQKGIIHRDIKPSNILVTLHDGTPVPKVIDFGIAKATQGRLTDQTLFTAFEQFIGTPAYMSPEQAEMSGLDVDTRSDIYALGVLLYELLTGRTPFDAKELLQSGLDEMRRTIREQEPSRPSTRLSTMLAADLTAVAQRRHADAPKLIHLLSGDLDWIVMKALEKDRTRRYETANGLATDIQRYLGNEPVVARPPSTIYRFQKLVRRNQTLFAAAGVALVALIIALAVSLYSLKLAVAAGRREKLLRQEAEQGAVWSHQVSQGGLLLMQGKYNESEQLIRTVPPHASMVPLFNVFGGYHARHSEWEQSLTNWNLVLKFAPDDHMGYMYLGPLLLQLEDVNGFKHLQMQIIQHFGNTSDPRVAERMLKTLLIRPPPNDELPVIVKMAAVAGQAPPDHENWGFNLYAMGFTEYRLGHYARATNLLQQAVPLDIGPHCRVAANLVLSMALYQLGQPGPSHDSFAKAIDEENRRLPKAGHLDDEDDWNDWIAIQILKHEAVSVNPGVGTLLPDVGPVPSPGVPIVSVNPGVGTLLPAAVPDQPAWQTALANAGLKFKAEQQDDGTWEVELDDHPVTDISMLRGAPLSRLTLMHTGVSNLTSLHGMSLKWLRLGGTKVSDLGPLKGMPLESLQISGTRIADLSPLRGMPLESLNVNDCKGITNLDSLQGMQLESLQISRSPVTDLSPLRGMPLKFLNLNGCRGITNLEPLAGINTLQNVTLPPNAKDFEFLRSKPQLERISFKFDSTTHNAAQTAAEFWAEQDAKQKTESSQP